MTTTACDGREIRSFIPGRLVLRRSRRGDYDELHRFHYVPKRPGPCTWGLAIDWILGSRRRVVAVGLIAHPTLNCAARERALGLCKPKASREAAERITWLNGNVRRIKRVVVHPQFRSLGLAVTLVRELLELADTRYVEAIAAMGRAHPFFEKAGMRRLEPVAEGEPVYYWWERPGVEKVDKVAKGGEG